MEYDNASWPELDAFISDLGIKKPYLRIWKTMESTPITTASIDALVNQGLVVVTHPLGLFSGKILLGKLEDGKIVLKQGLSPYERDKTLFHELAHLHHPVLLCSGDSYGYFSEKEQAQREAIAEWLGRTARANPELLRHAIHRFELKPQIYDLASYSAFKDDSRAASCSSGEPYSLFMD